MPSQVRSSRDEHDGTADGQQCEGSRKRGCPAQREGRREHGSQPGPSEPALPAEHAIDAFGEHGEHSAGAEFPHPGGREEIGGGAVNPRLVHRIREGGGHERHHESGEYDAAMSAARESRDDEEQRPDQVELLLYRQRPEVLHGCGRSVGGQVIDGLVRELPVLEVQRAGPYLSGRIGEPARRQHETRDDPGHAEHESRRRHEAPGPAAPEIE